MINKTRFLVLFFGVITTIGCIPVLRSARGLSKGQLQISYNAPFAGDIRYGLTDNLEYRYSIIGGSFETDIMAHYHRNLDYSIAVGTRWLPDLQDDYDLPHDLSYLGRGVALTISKEYWERFNPFIGYSYTKTVYSSLERDTDLAFIVAGLEFTLTKRNSRIINLVLTPEIMFIPGGTGGDFDTFIFGSLGIGIVFDWNKILGRRGTDK